MCSDSWDLNDANVVCKQLGYSHARRAATGSYCGQGCGRIWISNINCHFGLHSRLDDCPFSGWGVRSCNHSGYAGVICGKTITVADKMLSIVNSFFRIIICFLRSVFTNCNRCVCVKELLIDN